MKKIEGLYYSYKNKKDLDLSDVKFVRFNLYDEKYLDVYVKDGQLYISGTDALKITLSGGVNCVNVGINER